MKTSPSRASNIPTLQTAYRVSTSTGRRWTNPGALLTGCAALSSHSRRPDISILELAAKQLVQSFHAAFGDETWISCAISGIEDLCRIRPLIAGCHHPLDQITDTARALAG